MAKIVLIGTSGNVGSCLLKELRVKLKSGGWEEVGRVAYPVD